MVVLLKLSKNNIGTSWAKPTKIKDIGDHLSLAYVQVLEEKDGKVNES